MGSGADMRFVNLSDRSMTNSFTDEENNLSGPKRKLFRNEGESEGDISGRYPKLPEEAGLDLKSPHAHGNMIKIIDKFEISEDFSNTNMKHPTAADSKGANLPENSHKQNQSATTVQKDELQSSSANHTILPKQSSADDTQSQGLNLEKNFIAHHQRISAQPDDNSLEMEGAHHLDDRFIKHKNNESNHPRDLAAQGFEDLERELKALQDDQKEKLQREHETSLLNKATQNEDSSTSKEGLQAQNGN